MTMVEARGAVVIAPEVLTTVVRMAALSTPGVAHLSTTFSGRAKRVFRGKRSTGGIDISVEDGAVSIDLYVVAESEAVLLPLAQTLQCEITRAISDVIGLPVRAVNIHIEDVQDPFGGET